MSLVGTGNIAEMGFHAKHKKGGPFQRTVDGHKISMGAHLYQDTPGGPIYTYTDKDATKRLQINPPQVPAELSEEKADFDRSMAKSMDPLYQIKHMDFMKKWTSATNPSVLITKAAGYGYGGAVLIKGSALEGNVRTYAFAKTNGSGDFSLQEFHGGKEYMQLDRSLGKFDENVYATHSEIATNPFQKMEHNFGDSVAKFGHGAWEFARHSAYEIGEGLLEVGAGLLTGGASVAVKAGLQAVDTFMGASGASEAINTKIASLTDSGQDRALAATLGRLQKAGETGKVGGLRSQDFDYSYWSQYGIELGVDSDTVKDFKTELGDKAARGVLRDKGLRDRWHISQIGGASDQEFINDPRLVGLTKAYKGASDKLVESGYKAHPRLGEAMRHATGQGSVANRLRALQELSTQYEHGSVNHQIKQLADMAGMYQEKVGTAIDVHTLKNQLDELAEDPNGMGNLKTKKAMLERSMSKMKDMKADIQDYAAFVGQHNKAADLVKRSHDLINLNRSALDSALHDVKRDWRDSSKRKRLSEAVDSFQADMDQELSFRARTKHNRDEAIAARQEYIETLRKEGYRNDYGSLDIKDLDGPRADAIRGNTEELLDSRMEALRGVMANDPFRQTALQAKHDSIAGDTHDRIQQKKDLLEEHRG